VSFFDPVARTVPFLLDLLVITTALAGGVVPVEAAEFE
jgi:hypothetical protein